MATIKSYTDLEQSNVLATILPIESADMSWCNSSIRGVNYIDPFSASLYTVKETQEIFNEALSGWDKYWELIPCWSLAALFNILPDHFYDETGRKTLGIDKGDFYYNIFYETKYSYIQKSADNPVDACYEMVLKLHELKLL